MSATIRTTHAPLARVKAYAAAAFLGAAGGMLISQGVAESLNREVIDGKPHISIKSTPQGMKKLGAGILLGFSPTFVALAYDRKYGKKGNGAEK